MSNGVARLMGVKGEAVGVKGVKKAELQRGCMWRGQVIDGGVGERWGCG